MNDASLPIPSFSPSAPRRYPWYHWRRVGFNFLTISLAVHLLLGVGAGYFIVQTIQGKRKQTFAGPPQAPNAPTRAMEHQVQMQKKKASMSAPAPIKRITTTSNVKVALPALPPMPKTDAVIVPLSMAGMGGSGVGLGMGGGSGGTGGGGGGGMPLFGFRQSKGGALVGHLYDLKQDTKRQPIKMNPDEYTRVVSQFVRGGFSMGTLSRFYQPATALYTTRIFMPTITANEGPKAFGVEDEVQPNMYVVLYQGRVSSPTTGTFHFVGYGDDVLVIRFGGRVVLDHGLISPSGLKSSKSFTYKFDGGSWYGTKEHSEANHGEGLPMPVKAGQIYDLQILIGERPGGYSVYQIMIEQDGVTYRKDEAGNPILPIFRLSNDPPPDPSSKLPPVESIGPVWKAEAPVATIPGGL